MSMYRQLWLAFMVSMLLALTGGLLASMLSARHYLADQLTMKNKDNANALALTLSQSEPDPVAVDVVVASMFDSGNYELIRITTPSGQLITERVDAGMQKDAPDWFVAALPIEALPGEALILSGWKQFGKVTLVSHSRFAYGALWESAYEMALALALAGLVGGILGTLVLHRLRKPLDAVIEQAHAITDRRFMTIEEPAVPELRQLARAMNASVTRLKTMFEDEAQRLENMRREANYDHLTGLANRSYFLARLCEAAQADDADGGMFCIARLAHLGEVNQTLGRKDTDQLLKDYAGVLARTASRYPEAMAARLNGADFALLLPGQTWSAAEAEELLQSLTRAAAPYLPPQASTWLACGNFPRGLDNETILAQADLALAAVEAEGRNGVRIIALHLDEEAPRGSEEWSRLIHRALDNHWVRLVSFPVTDFAGQLLHRECPLRLMFDAQGEWQPAGRFLPVAERLRLTPQIDLAAVALGLQELQTSPTLGGLAINLSASSIQSPQFRQQLQELLQRHPATPRLWLEVAESGVLAHFEAFALLCNSLRPLGCKLGIEHFGRQFSEIGRLHPLGFDYLKVDASFIHGLDSHPGNQSFLKGLSAIAHGIGLQVMAEGVTTQAELQALQAIGFDGATGPAVKDPVPGAS